MSDVSLFLDESGSDNLRDAHYLLALVVHDQGDGIADGISRYESSLRQKGLPDIPFHASPLLNGHDGYDGLHPDVRMRLLSTFRVFFRHLPVRYGFIALETRRFATPEEASAAMRREIVDFLFDNLAYFQGFDEVKVYYDNGQHSIATAVRQAVEYALSKNAVTFRLVSAEDYRLAQAADYICTMELTALKYQTKADTATDEKFFGGWSRFKKGILKEVRAKRM